MHLPLALMYPIRALTRFRWIPYRYTLPRTLFPPRTLPPKQFETDFFGLRYRGALNNEIDWHVFFFGCYACHELRVLEALATFVRARRKSVTFVDVGANVGNHTLFMATRVDTVIAFEPYRLVGQTLSDQISRNRLGNVSWHDVALGSTNTERTYHQPESNNLGQGSLIRVNRSDEPSRIRVREVAGDEYFAREKLPRIDILKIDVEGYERRVLEGLQGRLKQDRPVILMELKDIGQAELQSERVLLTLVYENAVLCGVEKSRGKGFKLPDFSFEGTDQVLIIPSEFANFVETYRSR